MKPVSFPNFRKQHFILCLYLMLAAWQSNAQCPTVNNNVQNFCDIESILISDLEAVDNGGGITWYDTATSTTPLTPTDGLINGEDYFADDNTGACGTRQRVEVVITGPPTGQNFQGICLDDPNQARISDLVAMGFDVQWYNTPSGGGPLPNNAAIVDNRIYYADQANPVTGCRSSRLSVLVNVGNIPIPTGDPEQFFCYTDDPPTIADLVASGQNNWYTSISSAVILDPTTPLVNGASYYATTVDPPCESVERLRVIARIESISPGLEGSLEICEDDAPVDLFSRLGGSPTTGGSWMPALVSGSGVFDPSVDSSGVYIYTVSGSICTEESSQVTVTVNEIPNTGSSSSLELCENDNNTYDLFNELDGSPEPGGTWSPTLNSGSGIFDPNIDPPGQYSYTIDAGACGSFSSSVTVSVVELPNSGEQGSLDICSSDLTPVDLFTRLGGNPDPGGLWSPALASGTGVFDPAIDPTGSYEYSVVGQGTCPDDMASVIVTITQEPNPGTGANLDICSDETSTFDLFTLLTGNPDTGGTWSPELTSGTGVFDPAVDSEGTYTYSLSGNGICADASSEVVVTIEDRPDAGTDGELNLCSTDTSTVDLFSLLNGTPDSGGTWSPALNSGTGVFDPTVDPPGNYTYEISGNTICPDASASILVTIVEEPNAGTGNSLELCENETQPVDLFTLLGGNPQPNGFWLPALTSGTGIFDPSVDPEGTYTYNISGNVICPDATASIIVSIADLPDAGSSNSVSVCQTDTATIDLFSFLGGTPDTTGSWSPELNSGTGIFDPTVDAAGTYTYTVLGSSGCPDASSEVEVIIVDNPDAGSNGSVAICGNDTSTIDLFNLLGGTPDTGGSWTPSLNSGSGIFDPTIDTEGEYIYQVGNGSVCEEAFASVTVSFIAQPNAGTNGSVSICDSDTSPVDLFSFLGGNPDEGGKWTPSLNSGTGVFDPKVDPSGNYSYSFAGSSGCGDSSAEIDVTVTEAPNAGTSSSQNICQSDSSTIDLFTLLGGSPDTGGVWEPSLNSGTSIFDPSVDPEGTYTYRVASSNSCPDGTATVTLTLVAQLDPGTNGSINICQTETATVDLFTILNGTPDSGGNWSPALNSGSGVFDPAIDPEGTYTYSFAANSGCSEISATVEVTFIQQPNAGTNGSISICANEQNTVDLFNELEGTPDAGGSWSPSLSGGNGIFDPTVDLPGTYTYAFNNGPCTTISATVTVTTAAIPNAGIDGVVSLCNNGGGTVDLFDYLGPDAQTGGRWMPELPSGTGIFDLNNDTPGLYTYQVGPDACGLTDNAKVQVVVFASPDVARMIIEEDKTVCLNDEVTVQITNANQLANGDYTLNYELVGANNASKSIIVQITDGAGSFTVTAENLTELGITELFIGGFYFPDGSCSSDTSSINSIEIIVEDAPPPSLITDGELFCELDEPTIQNLSERLNEDSEIQWYDADIDGELIDISTPLEDLKTYYASQIGANGCESSVRLAVTVTFEECLKELIIPDGFSPNDDGVNDDFHIVNLNDLFPNFRLKIFNRYGNLLYEGDRNTPRWDGKSNMGNAMGDSVLPSGVYFYILDFNDGQRKAKQGRVYLNR